MRGKLAVFLILGVSLVFALVFARQRYLSRNLLRDNFETNTIRILTYATFASATGPGPEIIEAFKRKYGANVELTTLSDAGLLLERMKLGEASVPFDVVLGLDQLMIAGAEKRFGWREMFFGNSGRHPVLAEFASPHFVPIDWSPLTFIFRKGDFPVPEKFDDLLNPVHKKQFALQDPHSSSPGLQFFQWVKTNEGERTSNWLEQFKPNVNSISPSWAFSYGLFKKGQARFVFSYLTSLAFHWGSENQRDYRCLSLKEGHPVQVEYAAVPVSCRECELAEKFVAFLLEPESQKLIMEKNFMFPVIKGLEEGTIFGELPELKIIRTGTGKDLSEWDEVFKH